MKHTRQWDHNRKIDLDCIEILGIAQQYHRNEQGNRFDMKLKCLSNG